MKHEYPLPDLHLSTEPLLTNHGGCPVCETHESQGDWPWCAVCHNKAMQSWPLAAAAGVFAAGVWAYFAQPGAILAAGVGLFFAILAVLSLIDARTMLLPDKLTLPLVWMGLLFNLLGGFVPLEQAVLGAVAGYVALWLLYWAYAFTTGKIGMGYGDFKLLAAVGAWLGVAALADVMMVASVSALGYLASLMLRGKGDFNTPFPFGPFIALGGVVMVFIP